MASKNFTGYLRSSLGDYANHDIWRFTHISTTGEVVAGSAAEFNVDSSGFYNINVEYGNVVIESKSSLTRKWFNHGVTTINSDTTVTTLPALLNALVPASESVILQMQALLDDTELAKDEALQAKSDTESLFNNFDSSVADSESKISSRLYPDLYIPLNDSLSIERGYGNNDKIDVSNAQDGSVIVNLPSKSVEFSRASERSFVNKSGVIDVAPEDAPSIGGNGLGLYQGVEYEILHSEDFSESVWNKNQISVNDNAIESPKNGVFASLVTDLDGGARYVRQINSISSSKSYTASAFFKRGAQGSKCSIRLALTGGSANFGIVTYDFDLKLITPPEDTEHYGVEYLGSDWIRLWVGYENTGLNTTADTRFYPGDPMSSSAGDSVYMWGPALTGGLFLPPYEKTEGTTKVSDPDIASVPTIGNMPAAGESFSILVDCKFPLASASTGRHSAIKTQGNGFYLKKRESNNVHFRLYTESGFGDVNVLVNDTDLHKFGVSYSKESSILRIYLDGNLSDESFVSSKVAYNLLGDIYFSDSLEPLNGSVKEVKFFHRELSSNEFKAMGGAE